MSAQPEQSDLLDHILAQRKSPWPGAVMFIAFLAFVFKMTELFVR